MAKLLLSAAVLGFALLGAQASPVSKVVNILKEMVDQLETEAKEDEDTYQEMGCWCTTTEEEKTQAIANGEQAINDLTAKIEEATANSARLNTEIANLGKEVATNEEAMDSASALRRKQLAEFNAEEKDMMMTLVSLKGAVAALSKHHEASFLQVSTSVHRMEVEKVSATMQVMLHKHASFLAEKFTPKQLELVAAYAQEPVQALLQTKQPASGEIFGLLKAMKEEFETNLKSSQKEEKENKESYEELRAAKTDEISAGQELGNTKTTELSDTDEKKAQATVDLENTRNTLAADTKFLAEMKEQCRTADQEYAERSKTRQLEIQAVGKALAFLNSDEAHALFARSLSFMQTQSGSKLHQRRVAVSKFLSKAARDFDDSRLALLAVTAGQPSGMGALGDSLGAMVESLKKEQADEVTLKDFCIKEQASNGQDTSSKKRDKSDQEVKVADLTNALETLDQEIADLKKAIAEASLQLKHEGENREKANAEFQQTVADQRATQKLLTAALDILKGFYEKSALAQVSTDSSDEQPKAKKFEKNKKSGGVMGMMQAIIDDAKALEDESTYDEEKGQKDYEAFTVDTNESLDSMNKDLTDKTKVRAKTEGEKVQHETELDAVESDLEYLKMASDDLHKECDFTLKNFDVRQAGRTAEIAGLNQAIGIFAHA